MLRPKPSARWRETKTSAARSSASRSAFGQAPSTQTTSGLRRSSAASRRAAPRARRPRVVFTTSSVFGTCRRSRAKARQRRLRVLALHPGGKVEGCHQHAAAARQQQAHRPQRQPVRRRVPPRHLDRGGDAQRPRRAGLGEGIPREAGGRHQRVEQQPRRQPPAFRQRRQFPGREEIDPAEGAEALPIRQGPEGRLEQRVGEQRPLAPRRGDGMRAERRDLVGIELDVPADLGAQHLPVGVERSPAPGRPKSSRPKAPARCATARSR